MTATEDDREGDDLIAAEYVLGVLDSEERALAAGRITNEPDFARLVEVWQARLSPLDNSFAEVEPPAAVKQAIDRWLFSERTAAEPAGFWQSLALWRGLAAGAIAALIIAIALPVMWPADEPTRQIAALASTDSDVSYVALYDAEQSRIALSHLAGDRGAGRDFELWAIKDGSAPVSLGIIPAGQRVDVTVAAGHRSLLEGPVLLAISLEPAGGSPTGQPTGPVVAAGAAREL